MFDLDFETGVYWIVLILSVVLVVVIIPRFYFYTPEGDIKNYHPSDVKSCDQKKMLKQLYELSLYDYCQVRWHYTFVLSLVSSIFLTYVINAISLANIIISTLIFFIALEIPSKLEHAHTYSSRANKATQLYTLLK